ncbi:MAG: hypothetical protein KJ906_01735 [Nanoarchaeota archaeon]|nr:hypothetical protein [Nanoarchaeota archaeon]
MEDITPKKPKFILPKNNWMIASFVLIVLLGASLIFGSGITGAVISEDDASQKAVDYLTNVVGVKAEVVGIAQSNGVYNIRMMIQDSPYALYMTKDGTLMFPQVFNLDEAPEAQTQQTQTQQASVPKSDKPVVELFIMSECPYGTQIEKGIIPVLDTLGDKIDFNLRFVYYVMHGEKEVVEQANQYCIQKEQNDKFLDYLTCYLEAGDSVSCLTKAKIDQTKLKTCFDKVDKEFNLIGNVNDQSAYLSGRFPLFNIDKALNEKYQVGGSPTLIINSAQSSAGRDSASLLSAVCAAFNKAPSECNTVLSSAQPAPGFGGGTTTDTSEPQCG